MLFRRNGKKKDENTETEPPDFLLKEMGGEGSVDIDEGSLMPVTTDTRISEMDTRIANMEKKVDRIEAYIGTTRSELDDVIKKTKEYDENIKKLLAIYEVVSEKFNPFSEQGISISTGVSRVSSDEREEIEALYGMMAELSISILLDLIDDLRKMGIDTRPIEQYLPKEVLT